MSRYGRSDADIRADIAYAIGEDDDVLAYLTRQHRVRWGLADD